MGRKMDNAMLIDLRVNDEHIKYIEKTLKINEDCETLVLRLGRCQFAVVRFTGDVKDVDLRKLKCIKGVEDMAIVHPNKETLKKLEAKIKWDKALAIKLPYYIPTLNEKQVVRMAELNERVVVDNANVDETIKVENGTVELSDPYFVLTSDYWLVKIDDKVGAREYARKNETNGVKLMVVQAPLNQEFINEVENAPDLLKQFMIAREEFMQKKKQLGL